MSTTSASTGFTSAVAAARQVASASRPEDMSWFAASWKSIGMPSTPVSDDVSSGDVSSGDVSSGDVGELGAQVEDSLGVQLTDTALGHAEDAADVGQRESLEVVEADHDLLPLGQLLDSAGEQLAGLPVLGHGLGIQCAGVLQGVAQAGSASVVVRQQFVQSHDVDQGQLAEESADLLDVHAHLVGDLVVGGCAVQPGLQLGDGALELAGLHPDRPRDPVGGAELV